MSGCVFTISATATPKCPEPSRMYWIPCVRPCYARISKFRAVFRVFEFFGPVTRIPIFVLVVCRTVLSFEFHQVQTLDTSCTSTSGPKGSQPHFWSYAYAVLCVALSCCVVRLNDFRNQHSKRRETVTYVLETLCPAMACTNFDVSTWVSSFRIFSTRDPNFNKPSRMTWKTCVRACRG